jgi:hypothetical protein
MKTDLLKEAIADADAIKTLAIENAKASLNQAFDSKIKSMLAARLQEEAEEGEELEEEVEETDEAKKHSSEEEEESEKESEKEAEAEDVDEIDINKILAEMGDDEEDMEDGEMEEAKDEEEEEKEEEESEEDEEEMDEVKDKEEEGEKESYDEEVDLDALLKELEMEEGSEEGEEKMEDEEDAMKEAKKEDDEEDPHAMMKKMKEEHAAEIAEIKNQAAKLAGKVNETNLINAKLLYLNKILHKHNLNEAQKVKVIAAFDKATTVKEAKIVFESLNEAFVVKTDKSKTNLKESLGFASKAAGNSTKRDIISEADVQVARWQKLAGINKTI